MVSWILLGHFLAASGTALATFAGWQMVWQHDTNNQRMGQRSLKEQLFWFSFSYLFPFLPAIFALFGSDGLGLLGDQFTTWTTAILSFLLAMIVTGLTFSSWNWMRQWKRIVELANQRPGQKPREATLPKEARKHLGWTTAMSGLFALLWWVMFVTIIVS